LLIDIVPQNRIKSVNGKYCTAMHIEISNSSFLIGALANAPYNP
jgi:hypothetical protein